MNLDEIFHLEPDMPLVATNPLLLLLCVLASVGAGWFWAHRFRNTYQIEKSIRYYIPTAVVMAVVFLLLGLPFLFSVGSQLAGFVAMLLISNRYFNHK